MVSDVQTLHRLFAKQNTPCGAVAAIKYFSYVFPFQAFLSTSKQRRVGGEILYIEKKGLENQHFQKNYSWRGQKCCISPSYHSNVAPISLLYPQENGSCNPSKLFFRCYLYCQRWECTSCVPPFNHLGRLFEPGMAEARPHGCGQWWGRSLLSKRYFHGHLLLHGEPVSLQQQYCFALQ